MKLVISTLSILFSVGIKVKIQILYYSAASVVVLVLVGSFFKHLKLYSLLNFAIYLSYNKRQLNNNFNTFIFFFCIYFSQGFRKYLSEHQAKFGLWEKKRTIFDFGKNEPKTKKRKNTRSDDDFWRNLVVN